MTRQEAERCFLMVFTALQTLYNSGVKLEAYDNKEIQISIQNFEATRATLEQYFQTYMTEESYHG